MIKCQIYIQAKSISLDQDSVNKEQFYFNFTYDANVECKVSLYFCATQVTSATGLPQYFMIRPDLPQAQITTLPKGINQRVEGSESFKFNASDYRSAHLLEHTRDYFPIILTIEPQIPVDQEYQNVITYGKLKIN